LERGELQHAGLLQTPTASALFGEGRGWSAETPRVTGERVEKATVRKDHAGPPRETHGAL